MEAAVTAFNAKPVVPATRAVSAPLLPHLAHPNTPTAALGPFVREALARLNAPAVIDAVTGDAALTALRIQALTHLQHVSFTFVVESDLYPHAPVLDGAYPYAPTRKALAKAKEFFMFLEGDVSAFSLPAVAPVMRADALARQKALVKSIVQNPLKHYESYRARLMKDGYNAAFPEFADVIDDLVAAAFEEKIETLARQNKVIRLFRIFALEQLLAAAEEGYAYAKSIDAIERGVEFFDIVARTLEPEKSPPLYHSHRYEYYMHYLAAEIPGHVFFPTIVNLSATDLLKTRGVPIGFVGVNTDILRVDGFQQTPYEFFMHDVNHARRMYQFGIEEAAKRGISDIDFYRETDRYTRDVVVPQFVIRKADAAETRENKKIKKMIFFECLHEDALPADAAVLRQSFLRPPRQLTPFERIEGDRVHHIMEPGATTLAYVFRKLAHTFYDAPENRQDYIVGNDARSRARIAEMAKQLFRDLQLGEVPDETLEAYTYTDDGFPDDFRRELEADIAARALSRLGS